MNETSAFSVLLIEDDEQFAQLTERMLGRGGKPTTRCLLAGTLQAGLSLLQSEAIDLIILDLGLPDSSGLETLEAVADRAGDKPIIVLTGVGTDEMGLEAIRAGAIDYLLKTDINTRVLHLSISHAVQRQALLRQLNEQKELLEQTVAERTKSLRETIEKLKVEIVERKKAEEAHHLALGASLDKEREVSALLQSAKAILMNREFKAAARAVFDICKDLLGATSGYVALLSKDGDENELLFLESGGRDCTVDPGLPMPIRGLREEAYSTGKVVFENDFMHSEWAELMPPGHVALDNVLFAPLNIEGSTEGVIGLANKQGGFDKKDAALAAAMGEIISIALINSRTLESLHDSQVRFYELFDRMSSGVAIYQAEEGGEEFRIKDLNRAGKRITLTEGIDCKGKMVQEVFPAVKPSGLLDVFRKVWRTGEAQHHPPNLYQDHRVSRWLENYVYRLSSEELVAVFDDITERMAIQESLRKSEERYRSLIKYSADPIVVYDTNGRVLSANPSFENTFGWPANEIEGKRLDFVPEEHKDETGRKLSRMIQGEKITNFETKRLTKDGRTLDVDISATGFMDDQGSQAGYVVSLRDISDRKLLEKQLKQNEKNLRVILEALQAGVVMIDREKHTIEYANPVAAKLVGVPAKELVGQACHSFICPSDKGQCPVTDHGRTVDNSERILLTVDGKQIPILKTVVGANLGGKEYLLESFIDISELKRAQEEELVNKALQATIETAGAACHELNQPLQAIMNLADAALDELDPKQPLYKDLENILENSKKLASVTQKLSTLTSYETKEYSAGTNILDIEKASGNHDV